MVDPDVIYGKIGIIRRCLKRIQHVTKLDPPSLDDIDRQDIFALNLQRAVQASIDLDAHVVASEGLGMPEDLRENFELLKGQGILRDELASKLQKMVGFRNIAIHEYQELDLQILKAILSDHLKDLEEFYTTIVRHFQLDR